MKGVSYRSDIQGLRAIAVLAVMIFHYNPALLPGGFIGVDIFLVISGFLIASILFNKKNQVNYQPIATLKYFYLSRFKRLAPAYFAALAVVSILAAVLFLPEDFTTYRDGLKKAAYFNSNNYFATFGDYFAPANYEQPLLHTWSLAVEVQFYLIAPFIFLFLPKRILSWILPLSVIGFSVYAEYQLRILGQEQATYYSLAARLPAFLIGAWVALLMTKDNSEQKEYGCELFLIWLAVALIFVSFWLPKATGYFPGIAGLIPIIGAALLLVNTASSPLSRLLSSKTLVWIGSLSYSLYLWHWPVLAIIRYYTGVEILSWQYSLVFIVSTLILATASYYWIETPFRLKRSKKKIIGYASLAAAVLVAGGGINAFYTPNKLPIEYTRYADPKTICHGKIAEDCLKGDLRSKKEILVLGDSHAAMLNNFFDYLGKELHFKSQIITASSCVTIPKFDYQRLPEWAQQPCLNQIYEAKKSLERHQVVVLAGLWSSHLKSHEFTMRLSEFLESSEESNKKIFIMLQEPLLKNNPIRVYRFNSLGFHQRVNIDESYIKANNRLRELAGKYSSTEVLDFQRIDLLESPPFYKGILIYFDKHHINEVGAKLYAYDKSVIEEVKKIIK